MFPSIIILEKLNPFFFFFFKISWSMRWLFYEIANDLSNLTSLNWDFFPIQQVTASQVQLQTRKKNILFKNDCLRCCLFSGSIYEYLWHYKDIKSHSLTQWDYRLSRLEHLCNPVYFLFWVLRLQIKTIHSRCSFDAPGKLLLVLEGRIKRNKPFRTGKYV